MSEAFLIPISALSDQKFTLEIQNQKLQLHLRQRKYGLYCDLWINDVLRLAGRLCLDRTFLLQDSTRPLQGDFIFIDTQGQEDPDYSALGERFKLYFQSM
ncbi:hypothetical protein FAI41_04585 [Acetobacteraceae bacterium]|nr:hypothetical protein FAI41_04585 [Acetobacteraceae bacterium]